LQIPLRNGHPCLSLTVPTTKPVTDFHRQDVTHAGRTENKIPLHLLGWANIAGFFDDMLLLVGYSTTNLSMLDLIMI
ncbi:hypothetical protein ACEUVE_12140, partial [Staphylococcus pseudintermedius]